MSNTQVPINLMRGGHYLVSKAKLIQKCLKCIKNGRKSDCPIVCRKYRQDNKIYIKTTPFYADIDGTSDLLGVMKICNNVLKRVYGEDVSLQKYILRQRKLKYHIYFPNIHVSQKLDFFSQYKSMKKYENKRFVES